MHDLDLSAASTNKRWTCLLDQALDFLELGLSVEDDGIQLHRDGYAFLKERYKYDDPEFPENVTKILFSPETRKPLGRHPTAITTSPNSQLGQQPQTKKKQHKITHEVTQNGITKRKNSSSR